MIPTFVFSFARGDEQGKYLALDLGGTNLRVCLITLKGAGKFEMDSEKYALREDQKHCEGQELFDFIAQCLRKFLDDKKLGDDQTIHLGFTFSYPCEQLRIDHGTLLRWTKGFDNPGVEGQDVAAMFKESLEKSKVPIAVTALINDTTGTLVASNYADPQTKIAVIFGTGCNAAYMETAEQIPKLDFLKLPKEQMMAINCEWGAFDNEHVSLPRLSYDKEIDEQSPRPGQQAFEKMIAGLYLGEVFRLVLRELRDEGVLFQDAKQPWSKFEKPYCLGTPNLSVIEEDKTETLTATEKMFKDEYGIETTIEQRKFFLRLAQLIGTRAARLSACGIAAIVKKKGYLAEGCHVGADGSVYNKYPGFKDRIQTALTDIFGPEGEKIQTVPAVDGSGVGAALIAALTLERKQAGQYKDL